MNRIIASALFLAATAAAVACAVAIATGGAYAETPNMQPELLFMATVLNKAAG